jgi:protease YdgD
MALGALSVLQVASQAVVGRAQTPSRPLKPAQSSPAAGPANPQPGQATTLTMPANRLPVQPKEWPWSAIGRVNVASPRERYCTGTLVAPRTVVTAAHCLWDPQFNKWASADVVHFVVGEAPRTPYLAHSLAASYVISPNFKCTREDCPISMSYGQQRVFIPLHLATTDWAVITLKDELTIRPIPIEVLRGADLTSSEHTQIVLPGFGEDRPYLLAAHKGCSARTDAPELGPGSLAHGCETFGGSGSPVLLIRDDAVSMIGIATVAPVGRVANARGATLGYGVSAIQFAAAATAQ